LFPNGIGILWKGATVGRKCPLLFLLQNENPFLFSFESGHYGREVNEVKDENHRAGVEEKGCVL
jgi:hypothetical protein